MYNRNNSIRWMLFVALMSIVIQSYIFYKMAKMIVLDKFNAIYVHQLNEVSSHLYLLDFTNNLINNDNVGKVSEQRVVRADIFYNDKELIREIKNSSTVSEKNRYNQYTR